ncbi:MAG TPA: DUF2892 domain-containing protein [Cyclobacteriaceae bacterium]|jgi:hypothetical protein|nr:DUF2892 domain-containing protein [Cyclobacteriaceae bacterium]HRK53745.1 DUF2892 domain-containing protein [Cyclobacteriaceae bacterium]
MKKNMGNADRIIRILIVLIFAALYYTGTVTGLLGTTLIILSAVFVATSLLSFCPIYAVFGMNTCPTKKSE